MLRLREEICPVEAEIRGLVFSCCMWVFVQPAYLVPYSYDVSFRSEFSPPPSSSLVIPWTPTRIIRQHHQLEADGLSANFDRTKTSPKKEISPKT